MGRTLTRPRPSPWHQTSWDWRAAGNFICGGTGTGFLLLLAVAAALGEASAWLALIGLGLVACGLALVWSEIGRPLRVINALLHPRTSWMSREAWMAPLLFVAGAAAVAAEANGAATSAQQLLGLTALVALVFLYCQARMIVAAKGIPAWREPAILPLIVLTGLVEGGGLLGILLGVTGHVMAPWLAVMLMILVLLRGAAWRAYLIRLMREGAPQAALGVLDALDGPMLIFGGAAPILLGLLALVMPAHARLFLVLGGLAALAGGWILKYSLIARAGFNQGFALPSLPVRGRESSGLAVRPGWAPPAVRAHQQVGMKMPKGL